MKYRANQQHNQSNLNKQTIYLEEILESFEKEQQLSLNSTAHKQPGGDTKAMAKSNKISGLNNLGNSCFFNAILQNLSQTVYLQELITENQATHNKQLLIKHSDDYDSEVTDQEELDESDMNKSDKDQEQDDFRNKKKQSNRVHRSINVKELNVTLKEPPGALGRQLGDLLKTMSSTNAVVNPSTLFGVPSFKGFQQQDSHELLRNLLDAIKSEELRRRQAAILDVFNLKKEKTIGELTKKQVKRYGRLSSYTFIDKLFGGHLLSTIVCSECNSCVQRVEPFLDLSLPISQYEEASSCVAEMSAGRNFFEHNKTASAFRKSIKKNLDSAPLKDLENKASQALDFIENKMQTLSKHQTKKQMKAALKKAKKSRKNTITEENGKNEEETEEAPNESDHNECENNTEKTMETVEAVEAVESDVKSEEAVEQIECSTEPVINDDSTELTQTLEETLSLESKPILPAHEPIVKNENNLKLEAMKSLGERLTAENAGENGCSLQSCLTKFTSKETLQDKIQCDHCAHQFNSQRRSSVNQTVYTHAVKQYLICELPAVLTIHLKRFQQHGYRLEKSNKHVNFPLELDMSPYTSKMCVNANKSPVLYLLYGIVEHSGKLNSGHYTAYVKMGSQVNDDKSEQFLGSQRLCHLKSMLKNWSASQNGCSNEVEQALTQLNQNGGESANGSDKADDRWFYISDSHVSEVNISKVLKTQAYILFYKRIQ